MCLDQKLWKSHIQIDISSCDLLQNNTLTKVESERRQWKVPSKLGAKLGSFLYRDNCNFPSLAPSLSLVRPLFWMF